MMPTCSVLQVAASASKRRRMALDDEDDDDADKEAQASSRVNGKACVQREACGRRVRADV